MTITNLDIDDIKRGLDEGLITLVDVREPHEFAAGHIPGSVSHPLSQFDPAALPDEPGKRVVFSCAAGVRSRHAIAAAQAAGLPIDAHYAGGFKDWAMRSETISLD